MFLDRSWPIRGGAAYIYMPLTGPHAFGPQKIYFGHKILMKQPHDCSY